MFKNGGLLLQKRLAIPPNVDKDSVILFLNSDKKLCFVNDQGFVHVLDENKDNPAFIQTEEVPQEDIAEELLISSNTFFGDGSDGDLVLATSMTLDRDYYFKNVTLNVGGEINTNGFRLFVQNALVLSGGVIKNNGNDGITSPVPTVGSNGAPETKLGTLGQGGPGNKSLHASISDGSNTGPIITLPIANGGSGGLGGHGGDGKVGKGGKSKSSSTPTKFINRNVYSALTGMRGIHIVNGGLGGDAGGVGGHDGLLCGASGGSGGSGGGVIQIIAKIIHSTPYASYPSIVANGGNGAKGNDAPTGDCGGGGGGSGGGGGFIQIFYLKMSTQNNGLFQAKGGKGGLGGNGSGSGSNGVVGGDGEDGTIECANIKTGNWSIFTGSSVAAGYK